MIYDDYYYDYDDDDDDVSSPRCTLRNKHQNHVYGVTSIQYRKQLCPMGNFRALCVVLIVMKLIAKGISF